uniref:Beta-defensin-like domain-containing protein n=1 Tax=Meleagris gallopavo TaxID=9103 RepID=A0A803YRJ0_MELGA
MQILPLLFAVLLLMLQGEPVMSQGKREKCLRRNGFCAFLKCPTLSVISGTCSRFQVCCKTPWPA